MSAPTDSAARDDNVLWRWPTGPREWLRAGMWVWNSRLLAALIGAALGIGLGAGFMIGAAILREGPGDALLQTGLILLVVIVFVGAAPALALAFGCPRVQQLTLTAGEVRMTTRFPWRREKTVPRSDIRSVVIYEGDGTVVLLAGEEELLRARHVTKAAAFAEALASPTVAWPVREYRDPGWCTIYLALFVGVATVPMFFVVMYPAAYLIYGVALLLNHMSDLSDSGGGAVFIISIVTMTAAMAATLALPLALLLGVAAARLMFKHETQQKLLPHVAFGFPHSDGCMPATRRWNRLTARYIAWCIEVVGLVPPPPLQPDLRHGATPEMAAAALAVAEGTA